MLAFGLAGAGCAGNGTMAPGMAAVPAAARGATIAFESIDGPPVGVFQKLVVDLSEEAQSRQIQVVSREGQASYRIRGFLAVHVVSGRPQVAWVWDVYDADKHRALRITGEEPGSRKASDAWAAADDQMLQRIARSSVERLVGFLALPAAEPSEPARPAVASTEEPGSPPPNAMALAAARP
jgi:hypothetical protein